VRANLPNATDVIRVEDIDSAIVDIDTGATLEVLKGELEMFDLNFTVNGNAATSTLEFNVRLVDSDGAGGDFSRLDFRGLPAITKIGSGSTLELNGPDVSFVDDATNLIAGLNEVDGTLLVANGASFAPGGGVLTVNSGGFVGGDGGTISGTIAVASGGTVGPGAGIGTMTVDNDLDLLGTLEIEVDGTGGGSVDLLDVIGDLDISAGTVDFIELTALDDGVYVFASYGSLTGTQFDTVNNLPTGYSISYNYNGLNQIALSAVPEPSTLGLATLGLLGLVGWRRRRRA
jgi:hypothetical protein